MLSYHQWATRSVHSPDICPAHPRSCLSALWEPYDHCMQMMSTVTPPLPAAICKRRQQQQLLHVACLLTTLYFYTINSVVFANNFRFFSPFDQVVILAEVLFTNHPILSETMGTPLQRGITLGSRPFSSGLAKRKKHHPNIINNAADQLIAKCSLWQIKTQGVHCFVPKIAVLQLTELSSVDWLIFIIQHASKPISIKQHHCKTLWYTH